MLLGLEGVILVAQDVNFLSMVYILSGIIFLLYQSIVRKFALGATFTWLGMACYQWTRVTVFALRLGQLNARSLMQEKKYEIEEIKLPHEMEE